jgi:site-specific DNA-methyltransferase (adenine-specific)
MKIEAIKTSQLKYDSANARHHDEANIAAISGSLREFGQRKPIVVDRTNTVVAGNGTLEAAIALGWPEIYAVRIPEQWTAVQTKAFALADNRTAELASWNFDQLDQQLDELRLLDFDLTEIGFNLEKDYDDQDWSNLSDSVKDKSDFEQMTFVLSEVQADLVRQAIAKAKLQKPQGDGTNQNSNGNALQLLAETFLSQ